MTVFDDLNAAIETVRALLAVKDTEIAQLRVELDNALREAAWLRENYQPKPVEPKPEPPPPEPEPPVATRVMYVGSSVQAKGLSQAAAITKLETALGRRLGCRREFDADGADAATMREMAVLDRGRARVYSFKGRAADFTREVFDAIPRDKFPTYACLQHEAERAEKNNDPVFIVGEFNNFIARVRSFKEATGRTDVHPTVIYTGWLDRDSSSTTTSSTWFPTGDLSDVVLGIDPYDPLGKKSLRQQYQPALNTWQRAGGTRWGIAETGTHRADDAARALWIAQGMHDAFADGAEFLCWFHSDVGGNAGEGWYLDGQRTLQTFADHLPSMTE